MTRVLIVDQDRLSRVALLRILDTLGCEAAACTSAKEAYAVLRENPECWQLVITEIAMAPMDGVALLRAMREELQIPIPVIAVTVYARSFFDQEDLDDFSEWLIKPVSQSLLQGALRRVGINTPGSKR